MRRVGDATRTLPPQAVPLSLTGEAKELCAGLRLPCEGELASGGFGPKTEGFSLAFSTRLSFEVRRGGTATRTLPPQAVPLSLAGEAWQVLPAIS